MRFLHANEVIKWSRLGKLLYANVVIVDDFYYSKYIAKKVFWRFYWLVQCREY